VSAVPLVLDIKGNALDDGPGIRSVVFFKGCPLSCKWCHNPEGMSGQVEISYDRAQCVGARACIDVCPEGALSEQNPLFIDRGKCTLCFKCVDACPSAALSRVGEEISVTEAFNKLMRYKPFYDSSGGGVTLSGGEPTMHMEYASELLQKLKLAGVHTLLETCGLFPYESFMAHLYPYLDMIYFDIKIFDRDDHYRICGARNDVIRENFSRLQAQYARGGVEILAITPLVPGMTSDAGNMESIARFLKGENVTRARLMHYNPLWQDKCLRLGKPDKLPDEGRLRQWMPRREVLQCEAIFRAHGLTLV
jgi:pyruvate formate lyase activating enzyme